MAPAEYVSPRTKDILPMLGQLEQKDDTAVWTIDGIIRHAVGAASTCWDKDGVFQSERALQVATELRAQVEAYVDERILQHKKDQEEKAEHTRKKHDDIPVRGIVFLQ
jgi:hypothetical protein